MPIDDEVMTGTDYFFRKLGEIDSLIELCWSAAPEHQREFWALMDNLEKRVRKFADHYVGEPPEMD
jgi:hypothetical protein